MGDALVGSAIGSYQVVRRIGAGGMGDVYELVHPGIGKRLAAKVLHSEFAARPEIATRFFDEARAVNVIEHPGIVDILDHGELDDGRPYLLMELLDGESVAERLRARGVLELAEVKTIVVQVASALSAAHQRGIVHRDLKPENLFITRAGPLKVLDFGIAKLSGAIASGEFQTRTGELLGTPRYMAPEQASGRTREVGPCTDVYAMGAVIYELLTGRPPFASQTLAQLIEAHVSHTPKPARELRRDLPAAWAALIDKAMAKAPADRFATIQDLADAVGAAPDAAEPRALGPDDATELADPLLRETVVAHARTTPVLSPETPLLPADRPTVPARPDALARPPTASAGRWVWAALAALALLAGAVAWWLR